MSGELYAAFPAHAGFQYHPKDSTNQRAVWSVFVLRWSSEGGFALQERYMAADGMWLGTWEDTEGVSHTPSSSYHSLTDRWPKLKGPLGKDPCKGQGLRGALVADTAPRPGLIDVYLLLEKHWIHYVQEPQKPAADPTTGKIEALFPWRKPAEHPNPLSSSANLMPDPAEGSSWVALFPTASSYQVCEVKKTVKPTTQTLTGGSVGAAFAGPDKAVYLVDMAQKKYRRCPVASPVTAKTTLVPGDAKDLPSGL